MSVHPAPHPHGFSCFCRKCTVLDGASMIIYRGAPRDLADDVLYLLPSAADRQEFLERYARKMGLAEGGPVEKVPFIAGE